VWEKVTEFSFRMEQRQDSGLRKWILFFAENNEMSTIEQRFVIAGGVNFGVTAICEKKCIQNCRQLTMGSSRW